MKAESPNNNRSQKSEKWGIIDDDELLSEDLSAPLMKVSDDEMALNQIPLYARDHCAHWLIELKRCQRKEYFLPWKCKFEKHNYEACVLQDGIRREKIKRLEELKISTET